MMVGMTGLGVVAKTGGEEASGATLVWGLRVVKGDPASEVLLLGASEVLWGAEGEEDGLLSEVEAGALEVAMP